MIIIDTYILNIHVKYVLKAEMHLCQKGLSFVCGCGFDLGFGWDSSRTFARHPPWFGFSGLGLLTSRGFRSLGIFLAISYRAKYKIHPNGLTDRDLHYTNASSQTYLAHQSISHT